MPKSADGSSSNRRLWVLLPALVASAALLALSIAGYWLFELRRDFLAEGPLARETTFIVERGQSIAAAGTALEEAGAISDAERFRLGARIFGKDAPIIAGEYVLPVGLSMAEILALLQSGEVIQHRFTLEEGRTVREVLGELGANELLTGALPAPPPEGSLLPETYFFTRGESRAGMVERMERAMAEALERAWQNRGADLPLADKNEALILASIVEKETGLADERPRVAAVFLNRLERGIPLQSDPTVIYGLAQGSLGRPLTYDDLESDTPYNTYKIGGLPPTPIANPGIASIKAVLNPLETNEIYFVADGTGGHAFAETLAEHNRNVARWRQIQAEQRRKARSGE